MDASPTPSVPVASSPPDVPLPPQSNNKFLFLLGGLLILFAAGIGSYYLVKSNSKPPQKACTMEAKLCPDGSSVGRTGPNCEFTPCPQITIIQPSPTPDLYTESSRSATANWKIYTGKHYSINYPSSWYLSESDSWRSGDLDPIIKLSPPIKDTQFITIIIANNSTNLTLNEFIQKERGLDPNTFEQIMIGNQKGLINPNYVSAFDSEIVIAAYKDKVLEITLTKSPGEKIEKIIFDQILSTFKFL